MLRTLFVGFALTSALLTPVAASAQQVVELDLANGGDITKPAPPGTIRLVLVNLLPRRDYNVTVVDRTIEIPALKMPLSGANAAGGTGCSVIVAEADALIDQVHQPESEAAVGAAVK